jgi:hypothetical protein
MVDELVWSPAKQAGFVLAAWLADDRNLDQVAPGLVPARLASLRGHNLAPGAASRDKAQAVERLLRSLRPELDARALALPPRARALLARVAPAALRRQLLEGTSPARPHYQADEPLLGVLVRAARNASQDGPA